MSEDKQTKRRGRPPKKRPEIKQQEEIEEPTLNNDMSIKPNDADEVVIEDIEDIPNDPSPSFAGTQGDFNPYREDVIEREYAMPSSSSNVPVDDIPEPDFRPPSFDMLQEDQQDGEPKQESPFMNPNPEMNDLDAVEKRRACEALVDTVLDGYETAHIFAQKFAGVSEATLIELEEEDKIDLSMQIPVSDTDSISLKEFFESLNEQGKEALSFDPDFRDKVREPMIRIAIKKGWGMTDEQQVIILFTTDIVTKTATFIGLKKSVNRSLELFQKAYLKQKESRYTQEDVNTNSERRQPQYDSEPVVDINEEEDLMDDMKTGVESFNVKNPKPIVNETK